MTRRRWIADETSGNRAALTGAHAEHLANVLRARIGQEFDIATGAAVRRGRIVSISRERVEFELGEEIPDPTALDLTLLLSIFKFDRMDWAIEKCTELGVARVIPVIARRTDPHLAAASAKRVERWQRLALQASEQSRRRSPPLISASMKLKDAAAEVSGTRIVLAEAEQANTLREALSSHAGGAVALAVGPEGGWSEAELEMFQDSGWIAASLGATVLRTETAAVAAVAVTLSEMQR